MIGTNLQHRIFHRGGFFKIGLCLLSVVCAEPALAARSISNGKTCSNVFADDADLMLPAKKSRIAPTTSTSKKNVSIQNLVLFDKSVIRGESVSAVSTEATGRRVAVQQYDSAAKTWWLKVLDVNSGHIVFSESFTSISNFQFAGDQNLLVINGTKASDGQVRKVYVRQSNVENSNLPLDPQAISTLNIPGSKYWGVDLKQLVVRKDLNFAIAVQDSMNPIGDAPAPTEYNPNAVTSISNQQTHFINPISGRIVKELRYGPRRPVEVQLNPKSTLAAMVIVNPLVAAVKSLSLIVTDVLNPEKVLFTETADAAGLSFSKKGYDGRVLYNQSVRNEFVSTWSPDGKRLLIAETATGSVSVYDASTNKIIYRQKRNQESRWPVQRIVAINKDEFIVLREGTSEASSELSNTFIRELTAEIIDLKADLKPAKVFQVQLNPAEELFQSYHRTGRIEAFWFNAGRILVVALDGQIIRIPIDQPKNQQQLLVANPKAERNKQILLSVQQSQNDAVIFATEEGVFQWKM